MGTRLVELDKFQAQLQVDLDRQRDLYEELLFELRLMNRYSATILGEDLRQDEEDDGDC